MQKIYKIAALVLLAGRVAAQAPAAAPAPRVAPTAFRSGSYQLLAGSWRPAKLLYNEQELLVSDANHKSQYPLVYPADSVRAFAIGRDTFEVVHEVDIPRPARHLRSTFARHLYRRAGFQVAEFVAYQPQPEPPLVYTLLCQGKQLTVLAPSNVQFRLALAKVLHDYQALAQQLELDRNIVPEQLPQILTAYASWKGTGGKK